MTQPERFRQQGACVVDKRKTTPQVSLQPPARRLFHAMQTTPHELLDEQAIVDAWRLLQFLQVGYAQHRAEQLAACADVDVHLACWLLANGCDEKTALRILL